MNKIEKLIEKKSVLEERLYKEERREIEMLNRRGFGYAMRHVKIGFSTRKSDALKERIRIISEQIDELKKVMKADRDKAKLEAYHKQCPCWNSHNDSCYDDNCSCDRDCEYMKSINLKIKDLNESERKRNQTETS